MCTFTDTLAHRIRRLWLSLFRPSLNRDMSKGAN